MEPTNEFFEQLDLERRQAWEECQQAINDAAEAHKRCIETSGAYEACEKYYEAYARQHGLPYEALPKPQHNNEQVLRRTAQS